MDVVEKIVGGMVAGVAIIVLIGGLGLLIAFPVKWAWNATMPCLFGLGTITWGKAWCLHFLATCLIKSNITNTNKGD